MSRAHKFTAEQWLEHKHLIRHLWIEEDHSFAEVATELAKVGFFPTKRQFEFQVVKWGFSKYTRSKDRKALLLEHEALSEPQQIEAIFGDRDAIIHNNHALSKKLFLRWQKRCVKQSTQDVASLATYSLPSAEEEFITVPGRDLVPLLGPNITLEPIDLTAPQIRDTDTATVETSHVIPLDHYGLSHNDETYRSAREARFRCDYEAAELLYRLVAQRWHARTDDRNFSVHRKIVVCLLNRGDLDEAFRVSTSLCKTIAYILEPNNYQRLRILHTMAAVNEAIGNLNTAELQYQEVLQIAIHSLGLTHSFTITAMAGFASLLRIRDKLESSEQLYSKVLELRLLAGGNDFDICQELRQLADVLSDSGRVPESMRLYKTAEERAIVSLGKSHHVTLRIRSNLAADLRIAGYLDDSEKLLWLTFTSQRSLLGEGHPDTSWTLYQYAKCLMAMHKYDEALNWLQKVLTYRKQRLGEFHIRTLNCYIWVGWCSENIHQTSSALACYQHVLARLHQVSSPKSYSDTYRVRWLTIAVARTMMLARSVLSAGDFELATIWHGATQTLEITNQDGSPVQCVIEEESRGSETCAIAS